jgi:hypothetical protein
VIKGNELANNRLLVLLGFHKKPALSAIYKKQLIHYIAKQGILTEREG